MPYKKGVQNNQAIKTISTGKRRICRGNIFICVLFQVMLSGYHENKMYMFLKLMGSQVVEILVIAPYERVCKTMY